MRLELRAGSGLESIIMRWRGYFGRELLGVA